MAQKINLELKYLCEDFTPIRTILDEVGAKEIGTVHQKDYFFNLPQSEDKIEGRLKLRIEDEKQELIFYRRGDFTQDKSNPADVYLYSVKDNELLDFLKETLGVKAIVEKTRERWKKDNITFNLDEVKGVGKIFEIELETAPEDKEQDETVFNEYKEKFTPHLGDVVKGSNVDLVLNR